MRNEVMKFKDQQRRKQERINCGVSVSQGIIPVTRWIRPNNSPRRLSTDIVK